MWKLMQVGVFAAVIATNIEYQWTPNPAFAALAGACAAVWATLIVVKAQDLIARVRYARGR